MTYWYETPEDQKDTWHWMGVAISLAHTIGLHRDPGRSNMPLEMQRLWKRIWWSCFMRDQLVALGMRRPTRIKPEDYDVPMLSLDDFEIQALSDGNTCISEECLLIRDVGMQRDLGIMCVAKAKLCRIISHVLVTQYSVHVKYQPVQPGQECNTRSNVMLFPKKHDQIDELRRCDEELVNWIASLEPESQYRKPNGEDLQPGRSSVLVQRGLLHMVYYATLSALHRPQVLPSAETTAAEKCRELQDISRKKVREASREITNISVELYRLGLTCFLPSTGITVILPAVIIHLLDVKASNDFTRESALRGFCHCMRVLESLRENYAAAEYATRFLEAAIRKANIDVNGDVDMVLNSNSTPRLPPGMKATRKFAHNHCRLMDVHRVSRIITPPPENGGQRHNMALPYHQLERTRSMDGGGLFMTSASSPPNSDSMGGLNGQDPDDDHMLDAAAAIYVDESFESSLVDYNGGGLMDNALGLHHWSAGMSTAMHDDATAGPGPGGCGAGFMVDMGGWTEDSDMWDAPNNNNGMMAQHQHHQHHHQHHHHQQQPPPGADMRQGLAPHSHTLLSQGLGDGSGGGGGLMRPRLSDGGGGLMHHHHHPGLVGGADGGGGVGEMGGGQQQQQQQVLGAVVTPGGGGMVDL